MLPLEIPKSKKPLSPKAKRRIFYAVPLSFIPFKKLDNGVTRQTLTHLLLPRTQCILLFSPWLTARDHSSLGKEMAKHSSEILTFILLYAKLLDFATLILQDQYILWHPTDK